MQVPILNGIWADEGPDWRTSYPRNMIPIPKQQGISQGYLRPAEGIAPFGVGPGTDRGGIVWRGVCYRVMGNSFVRVDRGGSIAVLGYVGGTERASFDYSFDRLAIAAGRGLYYWNGATFVRVQDPDLGAVLDVIHIDGYFMTTDGQSLVVTDLTDPTSVNPLRYGSSEADPDPVVGVLKLRDEAYAVNRYSVEQFNNVGGTLFPFERNEGALLTRGAVGTHAAVVFLDQIAMLGGGRNEPVAVWVGVNGGTQKISTREIDTILMGYTEQQLVGAVMEVRTFKTHQLLYVHLPDRCLVYDAAASQAVGESVWYTLDSGLLAPTQYRARSILWCYDTWLCADPTSPALGKLVETASTHYGEQVGWEFGTGILYNEGRGAIFHELELVALPGRVPLGAAPTIWTSYSLDGETWSQERAVKAGRQGERGKRLVWFGQGGMRQWRIQRFRGNSDAHLAFARLEARLEGLAA